VRLRSIVLGTIAVSLVATSPTYAASKPKPACNLLVDAKGDGHSTVFPTVGGDVYDVTGGDIATGKKTLVGVLRVATTDGSSNNYAKLGMKVSLSFTVNGAPYNFTRRRKAGTAEDYEYTFSNGALLKTVVTKTSITWIVDRKLIPELAKPKPVITTLNGKSTPFSGNADSAVSAKKYADKYPSCVKAA
jgi:hypothetical protein